MLGRLIQTAASYGRGNNVLESATEESHTRNLLYGHSHQTYSFAQSPPTLPYSTPVFRPGSFDDRGGLELEEKDVRILIAQDAGTEEKPTLLFDSRPNAAATTNPSSTHARHVSMTSPRSPITQDWKPPTQQATHTSPENPFRTKSSTTNGGAAQWNRPVRDGGTREEAFLECMFGVASSAKSASTTKMHILPGKSKSAPRLDVLAKNLSEQSDLHLRRIQPQRSRTSNTIVRSQYHPTSPTMDSETQSQDSILITRLFNITLAETVAATPRSADNPVSPALEPSVDGSSIPVSSASIPAQAKKPKLVERKVPAFAIGLIINLPRGADLYSTSAQSRPQSRSAHAYNLSSASSSYTSDMQSTWSFLNAIPESLASSAIFTDEFDKRIETIVSNEDVILRAIALLEAEATRVLHEHLQKTLDTVTSPGPKSPKQKFMQRTNQRFISITDSAAVAQTDSLRVAVKQMCHRVIYALRIPRVVTGLGFGAGHWSDEARTAYRICGRKQQNFFLFTLLTAFLGQHTRWLRRLAPEWYRKQYRSSIKSRGESHALPQRTIIVSDQRAIARRLIFLLASFMPGVPGSDGLYKLGEDMPGSQFSVSSPSSHVARNGSLRRTANRRMRETRLNSNMIDRALLSTSADSGESVIPAERPQRLFHRKDSDALSIKGMPVVSMTDKESNRTSGQGTTSALTSRPATPVAVFSTQRGSDSEGYFPPFIDHGESMASAGLTNILRRSSSSHGNSSNVSSRWGSFVSGLSDILTNKQYHSGGFGSMTTYSSTAGSAGQNSAEAKSRQSKINILQEMVDQVDANAPGSLKSPETRFAEQARASLDGPTSPIKLASAPRLKVDDKDGVVDVDLDIPGFGRFDPGELFRSPVKNTTPSVANSGRDTAESIRSLRMVPSDGFGDKAVIEGNVAGYLKRHHEDFSLQGVRPYAELEEDVKRTMLSETVGLKDFDGSHIDTDDPWWPVCSTVIADMRTFSIRRLTLKRRKAEDTSVARQESSTGPVPDVDQQSNAHRDGTLCTFIDEEVKDFDTALADAIEKMLDLGEMFQGPPLLSPRLSHSRTASSGTLKSTPPNATGLGISNYPAVTREYVRQDCRYAVLGALEDIVKEVCNDLERLEKGRDIHGGRSFDAAAVKEDIKQENVLREGVKCWLLNVEQARVY